MQNIKIPTAQDIQRVENNNIDLPNHDRVCLLYTSNTSGFIGNYLTILHL